MRVGIFTNRFPYPPVGGIPRYLHGLAQALTEYKAADVNFLLPNLIDGHTLVSEMEYTQKVVKEELLKNVFGLHNSVENSLPQDVIFAPLSGLQYGPYNRRQFHSLYQRQIPSIVDLVNSFDILILAGSVSSLFSVPDPCSWLSQVSIPTALVVLFPLAEIDFYFGPDACKLVSDQLSRCANACKLLIVPSEYIRQELLLHCGINKSIRKIPHGLNLAQLQDRSSTFHYCNRAISISRQGYFTKHKNLDCLLEAWRMVNLQLPAALLTVVGITRSFAESLVNSPLPNNVTCVSDASEEAKIRLLRESRVFVLPSAIEAFSFSTAEALAVGLPVIGLHSAAAPELVFTGENGFLMEVSSVDSVGFRGETLLHLKPDPAALAGAIVKIFIENDLFDSMSEKATKSVSHLDWQRIVNQYITHLLMG